MIPCRAMTLPRHIFAILALLTGCSDSTTVDKTTPEPALARNGSRLRARWEIAGTSRRLAGWHDTELDVDCDFWQYQHGRKHLCLPETTRIHQFFADAACKEPLQAWTYDRAADAPHYGITDTLDPCVEEPTIYEVNPVETVSVFDMQNGSCVPIGASSLYGGVPRPSTTFVSAEEKPDDSGQLWLEAEDGARVPWGGWDGTHAVQPTAVTDGKTRWAPWIVAYEGLSRTYGESTCTSETADVFTHIAYCPLDAVLRYASGPCGFSVSFSEVGARLDAPFSESGGACTSGVPRTGDASYAVGAPIANESLLEAGEILSGGGPVKVRYSTMRGHVILATAVNLQLGGHGPPPPDTFVDTESGVPCEPERASDGKTRCLPRASSDSPAFADDACTEEVMVHVPDEETCGASRPPTIYVDSLNSRFRARTVLDRITADAVYASTPDGCASTPLPEGTEVYGLGAELPADRFAEVTEERD